MSKNKHIDKICIVAAVLSLLLAILFLCKGMFGLNDYVREMGYEDRLFDSSRVHTIDIVMEDWETFIENCQKEEYEVCEIAIDGEVYQNVGIRGKGNTSLSNVSAMGSSRYSFKVEFDHYDDAMSYYGLDKLSLNNLIQDTTYMKDYLTYKMMAEFGVAAPLCSFVYITVNGEDWGLYLAVEGVEDSFLQRNYGNNYGELYKPDSMNFGGGKGNGKNFDFSEFGSSKVSGKSDVKLQYIDDNPDSYSNIFNNAKTDITDADKTRLIRSLQILDSGTKVENVLDVQAVVRYFVVHNFVCNGDSYTGSMIHNYYLYEEDGKLSMLPWDYNLAYGTFSGKDATNEVNSPIDTPVSSGMSGDRPMVDWIFENETYTELYHECFEEFLEQVDMVSIIENAEELIAEYVEEDPTKFYSYEDFTQGVETLKAFCSLRKESVEGQLSGKIPSTKEGQKEDNTMLIDAAWISLSDMGTMEHGMDRGGRKNQEVSDEKENMQEQFTMPETGEMPEGFTMPETGEMPEGFTMPEMTERPDMSEGFKGPDMDFGTRGNEGENYTGELIWLGVSVLVLLIGLFIASKFKGKN